MTQSTSGYLQPRSEQDSPSTPEVAKSEAADVARTAAQSGGRVGETAGEQAKRVASETTRQARHLVAEGRGQLAEQAKEGQRKAAGSLHALADQLQEMTERANGSGLAPEMVRQVSERAHGVASWLDEREPGALLDEVRSFARRRPGVFLAGAAMAGVLVGRLTKSIAAGSSGGSERPAVPEQATRPTPSATPSPYEMDPLAGAVPTQPVAPAGPPVPGYSTPPGTQPGAWNEPPGQPAGGWPGAPGQQSGPVTR